MGQRPKDLTPGAGPRHFLGAELRTRREAAGLSLAELGRRLHRDASYLAKIERAERVAQRDLIQDCDQILATGGALGRLLAMVEQPDRMADPQHVANAPGHVANTPGHVALDDPERAPLDEGGDITLPVRAPDGRIVYVPLARRQFLLGMGAAAAGLIAVPAAQVDAAAAIRDTHPIDHFRVLRSTLADSDNLFGPHRVMSVVREQVNLMQELRRGLRGDELRQLLAVQTEYADLLGWLHQDSGDHPAASWWLDRALEWAHMAGDTNSVVFILARKSQLAADMGDGTEAVTAAEAAVRMSTPHSRLAAIAATYGMRGYALLGEQREVSRAYDDARHLLATAEPDDLPWGQFIGGGYIDVHHAQSQTLLGQYRAAADEYREAIAALPAGFRRDQGVYTAREALACAGDRDVEQAATLGMQALAIGRDARSGRILTELSQVDRALEPWQADQRVHQFRAALIEVKETQ